MTKQRRLITDILRQQQGHLTAEQVYLAAKQEMPSIAMGTVYRNLGLMVEAGELRRVRIPDEPDRFDCILQPHEHMICERCGEVRDVTLDDLTGLLSERIGARVTSYELSIRYVCPDCGGAV